MILRSQDLIEVVHMLVKDWKKMVSRKPARLALLAWRAGLRENNCDVQRLTIPVISCISQPQFEISPFREGLKSYWKNEKTTF